MTDKLQRVEVEKPVTKIKLNEPKVKVQPKNDGVYGLLQFPQDKLGITHGLRAEMRKIGGKIKGSPDKLETVMDTLEVLVDYLKSRSAEKNTAKLAPVSGSGAAKVLEDLEAAKTSPEPSTAVVEPKSGKTKGKGKGKGKAGSK